MSRRTWLLLLLAILSVMLLVINTGLTSSLFTDDEPSTNNPLPIRWGFISLADGFEGTPWDANWNENGTTTWTADSAQKRSGTYSAKSTASTKGYLTSDEIDASLSERISVAFWFYPNNLVAGSVLVQAYNGTAYNTLYDLRNYPSYNSGTWNLFNVLITDSQYFIAGFRLRLDSSGLAGSRYIQIDDVYLDTTWPPPAAPTGLAATAGDGQVSLDWNDNTEIDLWGYNVYRSLTSGGPYSKINASVVTSSNYTSTGLSNNTTYYYVVTAEDYGFNESGNSNEASATPVDSAPAVPSGLVATPGGEQISLDWNDNTDWDLAGYNVYRSPTSGGPYSKINGSLVTTSNYTDSGLYGGGTYYYVVTAVDTADPVAYESSYSSQASATATNAAPAAPAGLTATPGNEQISLDWNDNTEPDLAGYNVYRSLVSGGPYSKINGTLVATSNYTDSGLYGGGTRYYVVTAADNASAESGYSSQASATANNIAPAVPTGLAATPGNEQISLDWNDNTEPDLAGYNVYRSLVSGGPYSKINGTLVATSNYTDSGLYGGGTRYYVVTAVDLSTSESGYSSQASATANNIAPAVPTGLAATPGNEQISLDWNDNTEPDLAGYNVYRSPTSGGNYTKINGSLVTSSNYTNTGLYGGTYYYVVTAVDLGTNESGYSNQASATAINIAPAAPTELAGISGDAQVSLDWNNNTEGDLAGYNVYRSLTSGGNYTKINGSLVATSNYTDTGLSGNVTYYYAVTAVDLGSNESSYSNQASATPGDAPPAAPTGLVATGGGEQISLDWNDNTEPDLAGYNLYRSPTGGGPYAQINGGLVTSSNYTNTGLYGGGTYYYVVRAVDLKSNRSGYSNEASANATNVAPAAPTGLVATPGNEQISLDWNDNTEGDLAGYNVYRSPTSGNYTKINGSLVTSSNYTNTGLYGGGTYYYVVTAADLGTNESSYSNQASANATNVAPAAPTGLAATPGNQQISLDWNDNTEPDLAGYNVYRSLSSGGNYTKINGSLVASSNYTNTGLSGNVTYYYVVTAADNASAESGYSSQASATPWSPILWTQTSQADFEAGVSENASTTLSSGNVTLAAGGSAGGANMTLFWDGGAAPSGWTIISNSGEAFYQNFPRGEATYGGTGGAATHTHNATFALTSPATGNVSIQSGTGSGATTDHTHTLASNTISTDSNLPTYRNLQVIRYNSGVPSTIPSGAIAIFDTTLPTGWTRYSAQDNYFVQGEATANITGGSANHTHTVSITTNATTNTTSTKTGGTATYATSNHTHTQTDNTNPVSNQPPFITVILARADSDTAIPAGMIAMFDASPTGNWEVLSNSGGDFYQRFLLAGSSYGATGGSSSHNHTDQTITLTTVTGTASDGKNTQSAAASSTHTHTVGVTSFSTVDSLPPYINVIFAKALYYSSGTIASQVLDTTVTGSEWPELAWDATLPAGTSITFEVRASDTAFASTNTTLPWTSVGGTSPVTTGLPSGRYKQWRAVLTADVPRTSTSTLQEVRVYYQSN